VKERVYIDLEIVVWKFVVICRWNCGLGKLSTILEIKLCSRVQMWRKMRRSWDRVQRLTHEI
jgi:hypothetical protein